MYTVLGVVWSGLMGSLGMRVGEPRDAEQLSALALRSKAFWRYDAEFLEACRAELTLDAAEVALSRVAVAEQDGRVVGFYALLGEPPEADLAYMFVEPDVIGSGVGSMMWDHAVDSAAALGFERIRVEADPHAAPFYRAMGAEPAGWAASNSIPGRRLSVLRFRLDPAASRP